jgi:hypothetical protein
MSSERHASSMPIAGTDTGGQTRPFACATAAHRTLKDLRSKRRGQPVLVVGHIVERKGQEATFEVFNDRLAVVKFPDGAAVGYDPLELLLPTEIDDKGVPYFEVRGCKSCGQLFPLTIEECNADKEPTSCPECGPG